MDRLFRAGLITIIAVFVLAILARLIGIELESFVVVTGTLIAGAMVALTLFLRSLGGGSERGRSPGEG